ncbi:MAG TPA: hypothetical protein VIR03_01935 [Candidatus Saccharimonadales bacterium]
MVKHKLRERFRPYSVEVRSLTEKALDASIRMQDIPGYIGSGADSVVCRLSCDPDIVAKLPIIESSGIKPSKAVKESVGALVLGMGVPGLEQIVAYRRARPSAVLCRFVPGQTLRNVAADSWRIPTEHFAGLLATFKAMQERELATDTGGSNLVYDPEAGLTVIDYIKSRKQTLAQKVLEFASPETLLAGISIGATVPEHALRFRNVCATELGPEIAADMNQMWRKDCLIVPA